MESGGSYGILGVHGAGSHTILTCGVIQTQVKQKRDCNVSCLHSYDPSTPAGEAPVGRLSAVLVHHGISDKPHQTYAGGPPLSSKEISKDQECLAPSKS